MNLKLKWTKYCFLPAADNYNTIGNPNNIIFPIKYTKLYVLFVTLSVKDIKHYQNFLVENLKDQFI